MKPNRRFHEIEEDTWRIREFLRDCYIINDRREFCWSLLRWDYWIGHINRNIFHFPLDETVSMWEKNGRLVAVVNPDASGEAFLQIHPSTYSDGLYQAMLETAESTLAVQNITGKKELVIWVGAQATIRKRVLERYGYQRSGFAAEHIRRRLLLEPIPENPLTEGYCIRALGAEDELAARSWLSWKVFHPDEPDDKYRGWEWYKNVQHTPLYRRDLDLVAVAPDGALSAFCTVWFDDCTRTAVFEPVGTHPAHQKLGLGKAIMTEGLHRARALGATLATVSSYSTGAHALYESMGFTDVHLNEPWIKVW